MVRYITLALFFLSSCSTTYLIYEVGRPRILEENNAHRIAAKDFSINFVYSGSTDTNEMKGIHYHNDSVGIILGTKYGLNWQDDLAKLTQEELAKQNGYRGEIMKLDIYEKAFSNLFEPLILFEKKKDNYKAYIVGQNKNDESRAFIVYASFLIDGISEEIKVLSEGTSSKIQTEIAFSENGVE